MTDLSPPRHPTSAEERAQAAFDAVQQDRVVAEAEVRSIIDAPDASTRARMIASWGLGRVLHDAGEITEALDVYPSAVALAESLDSRSDTAQVRTSWALCLQAAGDVDAALAQLDLAEPDLDGAPLGRLLVQRALVLFHLGSSEAALVELDRALPLLEADDDRLGQARLHSNRGIARVQVGLVDEARVDFEASQRLADELGQHLISAGALHNLGWLAGRLGDLPEALRLFALAREQYIAHGSPGRVMAALDTDECEVQLIAGLGHEARAVADRVLREAEASGNVLQVAESHLLLARANLLLGDRSAAAASADRAAAMFADSGREPWEALATYVGVLARTDDGPGGQAANSAAPSGDLARLRDVATTLERTGWTTEAFEVRVLAGRVALAAGRVDDARGDLALAAAGRHRGAPTQRAEAWHATALLRLADGDRRGAKLAIAHGLRIVDQHRATFGARELRARASAHGVALASLGLRLSFSSRRAGDVLVAAERWRAGALAGSGAAEIDDDVAADLAELRRLDGELRSLLLAGGEGDPSSVDAAAARGAIGALERSITRRTRMAAGDPRAISARLDVATLRQLLGGRALVEYVEIDGDLSAVVVTATRSRLVPLGPLEGAVECSDHLAFAHRRMSMTGPDSGSAPGAIDRFRRSLAELDARLVEPLRLGALDGVVVVPPSSLQPVPWGAIPTLRRLGDTTLTPSAAWWLVGHDDHGIDDHGIDDSAGADGAAVVLVAGPDLDGADEEIATITGLHPRATSITGDGASTAAVLRAMSGARVAHLASHGTFRADNPMFSSLRVADGPLMVQDLETLTAPPRLVILTSCHSGMSQVFPGDELVGTATALRSLGVSSVIAPFLAVPDLPTAELAIDLHRALAAGASPSIALAAALESAFTRGTTGDIATAGAFHCVGSSRSDVSDVTSPTL